jgi:hypothetical protein
VTTVQNGRPKAPRGLSADARREWRERVDEFAMQGPLRGPVLDLITGWARAWDGQRTAEEAWVAAGRPDTQRGSTGQERRHHLAVAKERADRHLDSLAAKLERATYRRRPPRRGMPDGAAAVGTTITGVPIFLHEGRVWHRSAISDEWVPCWDEVTVDDGYRLRWLDADGRGITYCDPPPSHVGRRLPSKRDAIRWARRHGVRAAALLRVVRAAGRAHEDGDSRGHRRRGLPAAPVGAVGRLRRVLLTWCCRGVVGGVRLGGEGGRRDAARRVHLEGFTPAPYESRTSTSRAGPQQRQWRVRYRLPHPCHLVRLRSL